MYNGGDELNAIVCDFGSHRTRMGFAGEDNARFIDDTRLDGKNINGTMNLEGYVESMEALEITFEAGIKRLGIDVISQHPILWSENSLSNIPRGAINSDANNPTPSKQERETLAEVFFEKYDVPAYFVSKAAVLTCFANGRSTGLVVEMGHGGTSIIPVQEGYVISRNATRSACGGFALDEFLKHRVNERLVAMSGQQVQRQIQWSTVRDIKESVCRVSETSFDEKSNTQIPQIPYELPDGTIVPMGAERFSVAERYFQYEEVNENSSLAEVGLYLPGIICDTAAKCETDLKKEMFQSIILTGGSSCFENMQNRLEREVVASVQSLTKVKVLAANPPERKLGAFLGGSILGSLGSFHEMWISKAEYAEHGSSLVQKKCP